MTEKEHNKHDKGYKNLLNKKDNFLQLIQSFVHEDWVKDIDGDNLTKIDKEFITPEFREKESDLVYQVKTEEHDIIFYCLLELQSSVDFTMPFRLLAYMVELLRDIYNNTDKTERKRKEFRFPAIVPLVLYNGENNWTALENFKEVFKEYDKFGNHLIDFEYILFDVNRYSEGELLNTANVIGSIFFLDQRQEKIVKKLRKLADILKEMTTEEYRYIKQWLGNLSDSGLTEEEQENLKEIIEKSNPQEVEKMINNYARSVGEYKQEGIEIGIEIGEKRGEEKGIEKGIEKIVRSMLKKGIEVEKIIEMTDLDRKEVEIIKENT